MQTAMLGRIYKARPTTPLWMNDSTDQYDKSSGAPATKPLCREIIESVRILGLNSPGLNQYIVSRPAADILTARQPIEYGTRLLAD